MSNAIQLLDMDRNIKRIMNTVDSISKTIAELNSIPQSRPIGPMFAKVENCEASLYQDTDVQPIFVNEKLLQEMLQIIGEYGFTTNHEVSASMTPARFEKIATDEALKLKVNDNIDYDGKEPYDEAEEEAGKLVNALRLAGLWDE